VVFGTWPSRGLEILGFEIKSNRGDWLSELRQPQKAESIGAYCDQWYIVASEAVVKLEEVPSAWGWMSPVANGLKIMKPPQLHLVPDFKPKEIDRLLLMSIVRNIGNNYTANGLMEDRIKERAEQLIAIEKEKMEIGLHKADQMANKVEEFEAASGIKIGDNWRYPLKELGRIVKAVMEGELTEKITRAEKSFESSKEMLDSLRALQSVDHAGIKKEVKELEEGSNLKLNRKY
jgi:hypothetical protein